GFGRLRSRMCAGENRRSRLAPKLGDRELRIGAFLQRRAPLLDERAQQRAVLVQRGPLRPTMLLEGERNLGAGVHFTRERGEAPQAEAAQSVMQRRRTHVTASTRRAGSLLLSGS